jgi:hypothetical protein
MDSENIPADLCDAFRAMQQQVEAAHATWITALTEHRPDLADQLWKLHSRYCDKHERLEALLLLVGVDSALPVLELYPAYEALTSTVATSASVADECNEEASVQLDPHQRAAQTKRRRTRKALLDAALDLIAEGVTTNLMEESASRAGVGAATAYNHFATKDDMIRAVYARLLDPLLSQV